MITAQHLPGCLNVEADYESRNVKDSSEWKLKVSVFRKICTKLGNPTRDLFASRVSKQLPRYVLWKIDLYSIARDAFQINCGQELNYAFPPILFDWTDTTKVQRDQATMIMITPAWQSQAWFQKVWEMCVEHPITLPQNLNLLTNPTGERHPLILKQDLEISSMGNFRKQMETEGISRKAAKLISESRRDGTRANYESAWRKWSDWYNRRQIDSFKCDFKLYLKGTHFRGWIGQNV